MSLNAIKGVELGAGFDGVRKRGSVFHDELVLSGSGKKIRFRTKHSGGIEGGVTTGQILVIRAAMKPLATLKKPLRSVNLRTRKPGSAHVERSDICAVPAAAVIAESLVGLVITDEILLKFGGDSMRELIPRVRKWNAQVKHIIS